MTKAYYFSKSTGWPVLFAPLTDGNTPGASMKISGGRPLEYYIAKGYTIHPPSPGQIEAAIAWLAERKAKDLSHQTHIAEARQNESVRGVPPTDAERLGIWPRPQPDAQRREADWNRRETERLERERILIEADTARMKADTARMKADTAKRRLNIDRMKAESARLRAEWTAGARIEIEARATDARQRLAKGNHQKHWAALKRQRRATNPNQRHRRGSADGAFALMAHVFLGDHEIMKGLRWIASTTGRGPLIEYRVSAGVLDEAEIYESDLAQ